MKDKDLNYRKYNLNPKFIQIRNLRIPSFLKQKNTLGRYKLSRNIYNDIATILSKTELPYNTIINFVEKKYGVNLSPSSVVSINNGRTYIYELQQRNKNLTTLKYRPYKIWLLKKEVYSYIIHLLCDTIYSRTEIIAKVEEKFKKKITVTAVDYVNRTAPQEFIKDKERNVIRNIKGKSKLRKIKKSEIIANEVVLKTIETLFKTTSLTQAEIAQEINKINKDYEFRQKDISLIKKKMIKDNILTKKKGTKRTIHKINKNEAVLIIKLLKNLNLSYSDIIKEFKKKFGYKINRKTLVYLNRRHEKFKKFFSKKEFEKKGNIRNRKNFKEKTK